MEVSNKPYQESQESISLKDLAGKFKEWYRYLLSNKKILILAVFSGCVAGGIYGLKKPFYTAECTFVLEEPGGTALGQYAGLASMVGVDMGRGGSGIFQGDNIIELYKSRSMIRETLLSNGVFANDSAQLLIDRYIAVNGLREKWLKKDGLKDISFNIPVVNFSVKHDSLISEIVRDINKNYLTVAKPDKKLNIISVKVKSQDQLFAKEFTSQIVNNVNKFYVKTRTKKSFENMQILQRQADSVRTVLNRSIGGAAAAVDANPNANAAMQILRVPSQRRQIDVQASTAVYAEIVKNLEVSKISLRQETPLIQVVDKPTLPLDKQEVGMLKAIILGAFAALFLSSAILVLIYAGKNVLA